MEYPKFKVCVNSMTFNQTKYITDTLDGFVMQQTNFPFICIIIDDASTDDEPEIIRKYVEKNFDLLTSSTSYEIDNDDSVVLYSQHNTNKNCYFVVYFLKENHYSKNRSKRPYLAEWRKICDYEAICEGDDYWTDPLKLQKQADFLDANPQCSLTYHACKNVFSTPCKIYDKYAENVNKLYSDVELVDYPFQTGTVMYRKSIVESDLYKRLVNIGCLFGDVLIYLTASRFGTIEGVNEQMSVYRRHEGGISQHMYEADKLWKNFKDWQKVALLFGGNIRKKINKDKLGVYMYSAFTTRKYILFFKMLRLSMFKNPYSIVFSFILISSYYYHRLFK